jgi:hypothetical protein
MINHSDLALIKYTCIFNQWITIFNLIYILRVLLIAVYFYCIGLCIVYNLVFTNAIYCHIIRTNLRVSILRIAMGYLCIFNLWLYCKI